MADAVDLGILKRVIADVEARKEHAEAVGDPCFDCECCAKWDTALQFLGELMHHHALTERRLVACRTDCYVCQLGGFPPPPS